MFLLQQNQRLENRCTTYELQVQRLEAELERLKRLELEVAELRERLGQNSQNSSKPPSSPKVQQIANRRLIGGIDMISDNTDILSAPHWHPILRGLFA
jgi:phage shock protein A